MKIRPVGAELSDADRRTDGHDESNCRFSQFFERRLITFLVEVIMFLSFGESRVF